MAKRHQRAKSSLEGESWLEGRALQRLFDVLEPHGRARVAGGAVRDALLGRPVADVDIATDIQPEDVIAILEKAAIKAVPTGLEHGTVTAVAGHGPNEVYQVTTLRRDVETDGRRARVAFTDDWHADASRRDLTMNALYCGRYGELFDPLGGYDDLKDGRVRFVGDASRRIEEDYLRILRFFRFSAVFGHGALDAEGLAACVSHRHGLDRLSGERVHQEMFKLLAARGAVDTVGEMEVSGILEHVIPGVREVSRFSRLCAVEAHCGRAPDALMRLAALAVHTEDDADRLRQRMVLTNVQSARLAGLVADRAAFDGTMVASLAKEALYRMGMPAFLDAALFDWADSGAPTDDPAWAGIVQLPDAWQPPVFPLRGDDLLERGVTRGVQVGEILDAVEAWWIETGFPDDENLVFGRLETVLKEREQT